MYLFCWQTSPPSSAASNTFSFRIFQYLPPSIFRSTWTSFLIPAKENNIYSVRLQWHQVWFWTHMTRTSSSTFFPVSPKRQPNIYIHIYNNCFFYHPSIKARFVQWMTNRMADYALELRISPALPDTYTMKILAANLNNALLAQAVILG